MDLIMLISLADRAKVTINKKWHTPLIFCHDADVYFDVMLT